MIEVIQTERPRNVKSAYISLPQWSAWRLLSLKSQPLRVRASNILMPESVIVNHVISVNSPWREEFANFALLRAG